MENLIIVLWTIAHPVNALKKFYGKDWITFILLCVLYLSLIVLIILLFLRLFAFFSGAIASVYSVYKEDIDFGIFLLIGFAVLIYYLRQRRAPKAPPQPVTVDIDTEQKAAERTYINIVTVILPLLQKLSRVFPLVTPVQASDIYSPARARKNNEIWYYKYVALKNGVTDAETIKRFLNDELTRILFDHEAHGLASNTVFIGGVEYPALVISDVRDIGTYLEISVVVMTDKVNKHLNFRHSSSLDAREKGVNVDDDQFIR